MPTSLNVGVTWPNNAWARLSFSTGTGFNSNATYFASDETVVGPLPAVEDVDSEERIYAFLDETGKFKIMSLDSQSKELAVLAVPKWCGFSVSDGLECDGKSKLSKNRFVFKMGKKLATIDFKR